MPATADLATDDRRAVVGRRAFLITREPAFRRFWYPIARSDGIAPGGVVARRLLGVDLAVWRSVDGSVAAAVDRCPHRDARLSVGWVDGCHLVCPYHGWEYGADGRCARIPQFDDGALLPPLARLASVRSDERYGWVWACLDDDPVLPLPEIPEAGSSGWRTIHEPESEWSCPAPMLVENNLDPAHIAFVHRGSFGTPAEPKVPVADVARTATGLRSRYEIPVQGRPGEMVPTVRSTTSDLYGPLLMLIRILYPDGVEHLMVKACTPVDDTATRQLQQVIRNDGEAARPGADIVAFDAEVWREDKAVLETAHHDWCLDLTANVHIRHDRPSIELRRFVGDVAAGVAFAR